MLKTMMSKETMDEMRIGSEKNGVNGCFIIVDLLLDQFC